MRRRLTVLTIPTLCSVLIACNTGQPRFESMTEAQLIAYNQTVSAQDQVFCSEQLHTGSHIRKRVCMSVKQMTSGLPTTLKIPSSSTSVYPNAVITN